MEIDLMPDKGEGRVSCLYQGRENNGRERVVHVPEGLEDALAFFMEGHTPKRTLLPARDRASAAKTEAMVERFDFAGVIRVHVIRPGEDFLHYIGTTHQQAAANGFPNVQWFLNLGVPECGEAARMLLKHGCFPAGFMPRWFDDDGLLLQKLDFDPGWDRPQLYSDRAREMLSRLYGYHRERIRA